MDKVKEISLRLSLRWGMMCFGQTSLANALREMRDPDPAAFLTFSIG